MNVLCDVLTEGFEKQIAKSGLPLHAFDDFETAAKKCIELANAAS